MGFRQAGSEVQCVMTGNDEVNRERTKAELTSMT